jgi:hypothetical protein
VIEVAALILFVFTLILLNRLEQFEALVAVMPQLVLLIGGQGAIAGGGPLVSQAIDSIKGKKDDY